MKKIVLTWIRTPISRLTPWKWEITVALNLIQIISIYLSIYLSKSHHCKALFKYHNLLFSHETGINRTKKFTSKTDSQRIYISILSSKRIKICNQTRNLVTIIIKQSHNDLTSLLREAATAAEQSFWELSLHSSNDCASFSKEHCSFIYSHYTFVATFRTGEMKN